VSALRRTVGAITLAVTLLAAVACSAIAAATREATLGDAAIGLPEKQDPRRDEDRATRASRRAFYTAPPVVSHEGASGMNVAACLGCHGQAGTRTPHPQHTNCMQCHVAAENPFGESVDLPANTFAGLAPPRSLVPAAAETPPSMPHRLTLRENCLACHDPDGMYESLRTPHPERVNCVQCHLPLPAAEFTR